MGRSTTQKNVLPKPVHKKNAAKASARMAANSKLIEKPQTEHSSVTGDKATSMSE